LQSPGDYQDRHVIGILFDQETFGALSQVAEFAMEEVLDQTGLGDDHFGVVVCDNATSSRYDTLNQDDANERVSEYLADEIGAVAIIGPATSDRAERAFRKVEPFGTLVMSPSATSPVLTDIDGTTSSYTDPGLFWRTSPPDDLQGRTLAEVMNADGVANAAVIFEQGNYGTYLGQKIQSDARQEYDIEVVLKPYDGDSLEDLTTKIKQVEGDAEADPQVPTLDVDAVVFISTQEEHTKKFLRTVTERDSDSGHTCDSPSICPFRDGGARIYLADGAKDEANFNDVSGVERIVDRIKGTSPATADDDVYAAFVDTLDAEYGDGFADSRSFTAHSYDAAWLIIYGAAWSYYNEAQVTGLGIARGLRQISKKGSGESITVGRNAWTTVRAKFAERTPIDVRGASGDLDYDSTSGETSAEIDVWCVDMEDGTGTFGLYDFEDEECVLTD